MLQQDGTITAIGAFADLHRDNPGAPVVGDGQQVLLPGFVNAHNHIGLSTVQLGISDETLELCALAKADARTAKTFIAAKTPVAKVRASLLDSRASGSGESFAGEERSSGGQSFGRSSPVDKQPALASGGGH